MNEYDVIVVGAGSSGLMSAISAAQNGAKVCLIEKNKKAGKKLLMTGGGRCNVTNNKDIDGLIAHIIGNGKFLYSVFHQFNSADIIEFFQSNGLALKEEDHGRMFPVTDKSKSIVELLFTKVQELGVSFINQSAVVGLIKEGGQLKGVKTETEEFFAPCVILSTGGRAYPSTGSTGDGYKLAKSCGHHLTHLFPTESPLISSEKFVEDKVLQGISLRDISLSVLNNKKKVLVTHTMDLLFTHFGLSGPAALRCSSFVNQELEKEDVQQATVVLDCFPATSSAQLLAKLSKTASSSEKSVKNTFTSFVQERLLVFFLEQVGISESLSAKKLSEKQLADLVAILKHFEIKIDKTFPIEKSFVTGGGINLKEINPKTLESKLCSGLFMTGELLDVHGYTGGYNVTTAFATGFVAGKNAAEVASYYKY